MEVDYLLQLSAELGFAADEDMEVLRAEVVEVKKMLTAFIRKLKADS